MKKLVVAVVAVLAFTTGAVARQSPAQIQQIDDFRAWLKSIEPELTPAGVTSARYISTRLNTMKGQFKPTPPPPPAELCNADGTGNGVDENGDGVIDEGCIVPPPPPPAGVVLGNLTVNPSVVDGGGSVTLTATLTSPALGARDVLLSATPSGVIPLPAAIRVKEAATSGSVMVAVGNPSVQTVVTITGVLGTDTATATVTVNPSGTPPPPPPPPAPTGDFAALCQSSATLACYSLQDDAQLNTYKHSNARPRKVFYLYPNDPDPRQQDAAKITIDASSNSLTNQIRLPIPVYSGALLVQWDAWMGREFAYGTAGIPNYKHFQLASGGNIWTEIRSRFSLGVLAPVDLRYYGSPGPGTIVGAGTVDGINYGTDQALGPMVGTFIVAPETWTRYWIYLNPAGTWTELSLWVADVHRDPVQILDRALVTPRPGYTRWDSFWLEYNTSTDLVKAGRPDLISYARHVVMLQGVGDPRPLLKRP